MSHASKHYRKQIEDHETLNKRLKAEGKPKVYLSSEVVFTGTLRRENEYRDKCR